MRRWLHRRRLVGVRKSTSVLKDQRPILGTPEVPEGTQLIHRVECPYGPLVEERNWTLWLAAYTPSPTFRRVLLKLNIAVRKVLTIRNWKVIRDTLLTSITRWQTMDGRTWQGAISRNLKTTGRKSGVAMPCTAWIPAILRKHWL